MLSRRSLLLAGAWGALGRARPTRAQDSFGGMRGALDASRVGVVPGAFGDQGAALARALDTAELNAQPLFLPPGTYEVRELTLPRHAHLIGVPGRTRLLFNGGRFMLQARDAALLRMEGLVLDGVGLPLDPSVPGLLHADNVDDLVLDDCEFVGSAAAGAFLRACAGRVERSQMRDARTVGLSLEQSRGMAVFDNVVADCGDTGILVQRDAESGDDTMVRGNRVSAIRADSGGTGQYGNGINISKANGVIVADNRVDDCAFSGIRFFSCDNVQATGNILTRLREMALYVEFAFEGAVVANNLIDGAVNGISFANFMQHGGRLGVCSGNIVRNISGGPRYADGNPQIGAGIAAEADMAITGNVIENAVHGLNLGWGPHLRDVGATGNVIRRTKIGIAVSVAEGAGAAIIADNLISGAEQGAILGMRWEEVASKDLAVAGAEAFPHLTVEGNRVS